MRDRRPRARRRGRDRALSRCARAGRRRQAACAELNPETASKLEREEGKPCEDAITGASSCPKGGTRVADTRVYVTSAFSSLAEGTADFLDETPTGWKVSAAGCKPRPGKPYDCDLES